MTLSYLHTDPKTFNNHGHQRLYPFENPLHFDWLSQIEEHILFNIFLHKNIDIFSLDLIYIALSFKNKSSIDNSST